MNINAPLHLIGSFQSSDPISKSSPITNASITNPATDTSAVSPAALLLNQLSELQKQNPAQFSQVLTQITNRLNEAAQTASNSGNTQQATQLSQLATSFQNAATSGQLPTAQQLQQAGLTGPHHHGGHHGGGHGNLLNALQPSSSPSA